MRSFLAALRTLVLPYGRTSGTRIILDGVNGRIDVYDSADDLITRIDGNGYHLYDAGGNEIGLLDKLGLVVRKAGSGSYVKMGFGSTAAILSLMPPGITGITFSQPALIYGSSLLPSKAALALLSPEINGGDQAVIQIWGEDTYTGTLEFIDLIAAGPVRVLHGILEIWSHIADLNGVRYLKGETGVTSCTVTAAASATFPIAFTQPVPIVPNVAVNIAGAAGAYARWGARAINIDTLGFDLFLFSVNPAATAASFTVDVGWTATVPG